MARADRRRPPSLRVEALEDRVLPSGSTPTIPQHYPNIRIAELAYGGTPLDPAQIQLLQNSVDLVVQGSTTLGAVSAAAPGTPQLVYTNLSNLYGPLLADWMNYADANGLNPEDPFYHVTQATPFWGTSPSSQPVNMFSAVYRGGGQTWSDQTALAYYAGGIGVPFARAGDSLALGYLMPFREINLNLVSGAWGGWSAQLEYPNAVDSAGNPTGWGVVHLVSDTTAGFSQSGQITFDPPPDWQPAIINGSTRMYFVRIHTLTPGTAPVANAIRGRDYVNAYSTTSGVVPAFDWSADTDGDGYLNDAEYANRKPGMDARFWYESRLFYPNYGQMRFATDPSNTTFRAWAADYEARFLAAQPQAEGLFVDNSSGVAPATPDAVIESVANYSANYAGLLQATGVSWIMPNTGGGGVNGDPAVQATQNAFEENALAPLAQNYLDFEAMAALVAHRASLTWPAPYQVLDSLPTGGWPTDPRTQLATLAEYYLVADPQRTFLDFYGGYAPATSWTQHWSPAAAYNIGQPMGGWYVATTGADPSDPALTYKVYRRWYTNGVVLYKPLSYGNGVTGSTSDSTGTMVYLPGTYYLLNADGTLGPARNAVWIRNGEGIILVKGPSVTASSLSLAGLPTSVTAGQQVSFTVTPRAANGAVAVGYTGTVYFSSSDQAAGLPANYTFTAADNGSHTFTVRFASTGPQLLVATDTAQPTINASAGLTVNPAPAALVTAARLAINAPASSSSGQWVPVTLTALDNSGNVVTGYRGAVHFLSTDGSASLPSDYTFTASDQGEHTFWLALRSTGSQIVMVTDKNSSPATGSAVVSVS
jgi:hypothetical protein